MVLRRFTQSIAAAAKSLQLKPTVPSAPTAHLGTGRYLNAEEVKASEAKASHALANRQHSQAAETFEQLATHGPWAISADAYGKAYSAYFSARRFDRAIVMALNYGACSGDELEGQRKILTAHVWAKDWPKLVLTAENVIERFPQSHWGHYYMLLAAMMHNDIDTVRKHGAQAVSLQPDFEAAWIDWAKTEKKLGFPQDAIRIAQHGLSNCPKNETLTELSKVHP